MSVVYNPGQRGEDNASDRVVWLSAVTRKLVGGFRWNFQGRFMWVVGGRPIRFERSKDPQSLVSDWYVMLMSFDAQNDGITHAER